MELVGIYGHTYTLSQELWVQPEDTIFWSRVSNPVCISQARKYINLPGQTILQTNKVNPDAHMILSRYTTRCSMCIAIWGLCMYVLMIKKNEEGLNIGRPKLHL